jgi:hypothetical protein
MSKVESLCSNFLPYAPAVATGMSEFQLSCYHVYRPMILKLPLAPNVIAKTPVTQPVHVVEGSHMEGGIVISRVV